MTSVEFDFGIEKLKNVFGKNHYPAERQVILFREVQGLDLKQWNRVLEELIGANRTAPMLKEFRDAIVNSRDHSLSIVKQQNEKKIESALSKLDVSEIFALATKKATGEMSAEHFKEYISILDRAIPGKRECCRGGEKAVYERSTGAIYAFRCNCQLGQNLRNSWPIWDPHRHNSQFTTEYEK